MEFIQRSYIAVLSALQCKKGHKNIIKHKLTYNPTVHILKRKEKKTKTKTKNKPKTTTTKKQNQKQKKQTINESRGRQAATKD